MTTISSTPFADSSFVLATLERPMSLREVLNLLPSAPVQTVTALEHQNDKPKVIQVALTVYQNIGFLASLLEVLEPICTEVTVSLASKVEDSTLERFPSRQTLVC